MNARQVQKGHLVDTQANPASLDWRERGPPALELRVLTRDRAPLFVVLTDLDNQRDRSIQAAIHAVVDEHRRYLLLRAQVEFDPRILFFLGANEHDWTLVALLRRRDAAVVLQLRARS